MSGAERMDAIAAAWADNREDLLRFVRNMVVRPELAEEIVQHAAQRAIAAVSAPDEPLETRKWLFRIASNLAIDELRRQGTWPETALLDSREDGEADESFVAASQTMRGTPEVSAIANQHLAFCFACTLRSLPPERAAALLLIEMYGFTVKETASILSASPAQAKNWLQDARAALKMKFAETCALIGKQGVCYQCSELAEFFNGRPENPLATTPGTSADRLRIARSAGAGDLSAWHRLLLAVIEKSVATRRGRVFTTKIPAE